MIWSMPKLCGRCDGGNSLNVPMNAATIAWAPISKYPLWIVQSQ
jgi:hypothetical protein